MSEMSEMNESNKSTSKYLGVYYNSNAQKWVVELERLKHYPCFQEEKDAGIYAEYYYRKLYNKSPNFPELSVAELEREYQTTLSKREIENAINRSSSKQGLVKSKIKTSKYVGVFLKENAHWVARIQYRGKSIYICSISKNQENAEERAAREYDKKALEIYGENAKLNFPL